MAKSRRRGGGESRRRLGFEKLEERRMLSVSVDIASKAAWSPLGANGDSRSGSQLISADGRYLYFHSDATNLVAGLEYLEPDARKGYRLELASGEIELVTFAGSRNIAATGDCEVIDVSEDGNVVLFRGSQKGVRTI